MDVHSKQLLLFFRLHWRFVGGDSPKITNPNSHPWIYSTIGFPTKG